MCYKYVEEWEQYTKPSGKVKERLNKYNKLISISAAEKSQYTNDPDIAVRVCRYHILDGYRFSHCGLIMGEHQIKWAREKGYKILYITHDINRLQGDYDWQPKSDYIVERKHDGKIKE